MVGNGAHNDNDFFLLNCSSENIDAKQKKTRQKKKNRVEYLLPEQIPACEKPSWEAKEPDPSMPVAYGKPAQCRNRNARNRKQSEKDNKTELDIFWHSRGTKKNKNDNEDNNDNNNGAIIVRWWCRYACLLSSILKMVIAKEETKKRNRDSDLYLKTFFSFKACEGII